MLSCSLLAERKHRCSLSNYFHSKLINCYLVPNWLRGNTDVSCLITLIQNYKCYLVPYWLRGNTYVSCLITFIQNKKCYLVPYWLKQNCRRKLTNKVRAQNAALFPIGKHITWRKKNVSGLMYLKLMVENTQL